MANGPDLPSNPVDFFPELGETQPSFTGVGGAPSFGPDGSLNVFDVSTPDPTGGITFDPSGNPTETARATIPDNLSRSPTPSPAPRETSRSTLPEICRDSPMRPTWVSIEERAAASGAPSRANPQSAAAERPLRSWKAAAWTSIASCC